LLTLSREPASAAAAKRNNTSPPTPPVNSTNSIVYGMLLLLVTIQKNKRKRAPAMRTTRGEERKTGTEEIPLIPPTVFSRFLKRRQGLACERRPPQWGTVKKPCWSNPSSIPEVTRQASKHGALRSMESFTSGCVWKPVSECTLGLLSTEEFGF